LNPSYASLARLCKDKILIKNYTYKALAAEVTIAQMNKVIAENEYMYEQENTMN